MKQHVEHYMTKMIWCNIWYRQNSTIYSRLLDDTIRSIRAKAKQCNAGKPVWYGRIEATCDKQTITIQTKGNNVAWQPGKTSLNKTTRFPCWNFWTMIKLLQPRGCFGSLYTGGNRNVGIFSRPWRRDICNGNCVACERGRPEARQATYTAPTITQLRYTVFIIRITHTHTLGKTRDTTEGKKTKEQTCLTCFRIRVLFPDLILLNQAEFTWEQRAVFRFRFMFMAEIVIINTVLVKIHTVTWKKKY